MAASEASKGAKVQTSPGGRAWFLGVALEDPEALETRPVSIAAMDRWRRVRFRTWTFSPSGDGIVSPDIAEDGFVIAVDGPMALPGAGHKVREAMKHLTQSGKFGKPSGKSGRTSATLPGSVLLFSNLRNAGFGVLGEAPWESTMLLEVNLDHLWGQWAGHAMPKKTLPSGRRARYDLLRGLGIELAHGPDAVTHDQLDAAAAAFAAYLWATGKAKEYGDAPVFDEGRGCFVEGRVVSL
jgi:predicted nuclease with RNAse H fold